MRIRIRPSSFILKDRPLDRERQGLLGRQYWQILALSRKSWKGGCLISAFTNQPSSLRAIGESSGIMAAPWHLGQPSYPLASLQTLNQTRQEEAGPQNHFHDERALGHL
jgi:hypothetical protein